MTRLSKHLKWLCVTVTVFSLCISRADAKPVLHAYTLQRTPVLNRKGKKVAELERGLTIVYTKVKGNYVQLSYYGKKRYLHKSKLVLDGSLKRYITSHQKDFESKVTTLRSLTVYKDTSLKKKLRNVQKGEILKVYAKRSGLYKVQMDGQFGYVQSRLAKQRIYVDVTSFPKYAGSTKGERIADFAKKFVGNPYVWGGTSLTGGCDCSGFVQQVYKRFGFNLPRCSRDQATVGRTVDFNRMKPGDLIFYYRGNRIGHVTLYVGNGKVVQARGSAYGIVITDYDYSKPAWAKRII